MVTKAEGPVLYVDYTTTEALRAAQFDASIDTAAICEVDIVWGERPLAEAAGEPVDYVVASHVIEHVPDVIGWLAELRATLKPGGVLGLAIPDRRFTFDRLRRDSGLAEMVEAFLLKRRQPSVGQIFDACAGAVAVEAGAAWSPGFTVDAAQPLAQAPGALKLAASLLTNPRYLDAHVWVFTPESFLAAARGMAAMDLLPFTIAAFLPTVRGSAEFHVRLEAGDASDRGAILASLDRAQVALDSADNPEPPPSALEQENAALRAERDALVASRFWRWTAPLRRLAEMRR
jgi:SAM-dependent methyltransferase